MTEYVLLIIGAALINNFVLIRFLGLCPFFGVSRNVETAIGMSMAVIFVMTIAGTISWAIYSFVLVPFDLVFLKTIAFILVIASFVQLVEMTVKKVAPVLHKALGIFLPLIVTNCAVLGVALISVVEEHTFGQAFLFSFGAGLGWAIAIIIFAGIRERQELAEVPKALAGYANAFITAGLLSIAFFVFSGFPTGSA